MTAPSKLLIGSMVVAACAAVALRLFFIYKFPMLNASDSVIYSELAQNWLHAHVFGMTVNGKLTPVDIRMPGYPAILAAIAAVAGASHMAVSWIQVLIDLATCCVVALLAGRVAAANRQVKIKAITAGFWLAAVCPFIANYTTGILSEVPAAFFTACALLVLGGALAEVGAEGGGASGGWSSAWFWGGVVAGLGTLVRPDTPLILVAVSLVAAMCFWRRGGGGARSAMSGFLRVMVLMWAGLLLPLLPWAIRNWSTFHEVEFLAPRYTQLPGELVPRGVNAWTNTWLWRFRDVYLFSWKLDDEEINLDDLPPYAFDSDHEREVVSKVLEEYNDSLTLSPAEDQVFAELAQERTRSDPLRTYVTVPFKRIFTLWFTPRIELLPYSGDVSPVKQAWQDDRADLLVTCGLTVLGILYVALALGGFFKSRGSPVAMLLAVFCLIRTLFFLHYETPEPRYMLECYPAIIGLAAQVFVPRSATRSVLQPARDGL